MVVTPDSDGGENMESCDGKIFVNPTEKDTDVFPVTNATCSKCNHTEAYFWTSQTRAGDEAETKFFRCTKCRYTWREYH